MSGNITEQKLIGLDEDSNNSQGIHVSVQDTHAEYKISSNCVKQSHLFETLLSDTQSETHHIHKLNVDQKQFDCILEYLHHHEHLNVPAIERQNVTQNLDTITHQFDKDFVLRFDYDSCVPLISAANYLEIDKLVKLLAYRMAHIFTFGTNADKEKLYDSFGRRTKDVSSDSESEPSDDEKDDKSDVSDPSDDEDEKKAEEKKN